MPASDGWRRSWPLLVAALLVAGGYLAAELWFLGGRLGFPLDDSWIHLTFARNLAGGAGLAFRPGMLCTGSTSPLWSALLALVAPLPGGLVLWSQLLGIGFHVAGVGCAWLLAREMGLGRGFAALVAALVLATHWLVWSALSGMEIPAFVAVSLAGLLLQVRERADPARTPLAFLVFAVASLLRPEGLLLLGLALVDRCLLCAPAFRSRRDVRPPWRAIGRGLLPALVLLVPVALLYRAIGGSFLPAAFAAKTPGSLHALPDGRYLYTVLGIFLRPQPIATLLAGGGAVGLVRRLGGRDDAGLLPALWVVGLPLAYALLSPPGGSPLVGNFGRYFFPLFPPLVLLGVLGLAPAWRRSGVSGEVDRRRPWVRTVVVVAILLPTLWTLVTGVGRYLQNVADVENGDVRVARWLAARVPPMATLAVQDIGAIGYLLPNPLLDLGGIVSPEVVAATRGAVSRADPRGREGMLSVLRAARPDLLVTFASWFPEIAGDRSLFVPIARLEIPGNVTLAGDEIVVYRTPWTHRSTAPPRGVPPR